METAIKRAIEGGWKWKGGEAYVDDNGGVWTFGKRIDTTAALLDPLFWQALGKAEGWKESSDIPIETMQIKKLHPNGEIIMEDFSTKYLKSVSGWQLAWHRFIDHLAEGKDADSFFNELLK